MIKKLFILSIIAIPFNDFFGVLPLGEMQHEVSAYLFLLAIGLVLFARFRNPELVPNVEFQPKLTDMMRNIMLSLIIVIVFSFIMNFPDMFKGAYKGRLPIDKFSTSLLVVLYGYALTYMSYYLGRRYNWHELIIVPVAISVAISGVFVTMEIISWYSHAVESIYLPLSRILHVAYRFDDGFGDKVEDFVLTGRARGVCFEPPSLANYAGFAWPWVYAGCHTASRRTKPYYYALWLICSVLIIAAWSRTSIVLLIGNVFVLILLRHVYLRPVPLRSISQRVISTLLISAGALLVVLFSVNIDAVTTHVITGDSTSNITRFASMTAAFHMFFDRPMWGYGFGQYGFHVIDYMPPWGYYSWEIQAWLNGDTFAIIWPPVFSIYARFAAELGLPGLLVWFGIWICLARAIYQATIAYQKQTGKILAMSYPLIVSCYCSLFSGIALDSLRTPMMWISLGLGCCFVQDARFRLKKLTHPAIAVPPKPLSASGDSPALA